MYTYKAVKDVELIHKNNQILVPRSKHESVLHWYHAILVHPGERRMIETIKLVFTWSGLNKQVVKLVKICHECQMSKKAGKKKYGLLPPKTAETTRWNRVNVDLWGPKSIVNKNGWTYELHIMTIVDSVTGWFEQRQLLYILVIKVTVHIIYLVVVMAIHSIVIHVIDLIVVGDDIGICLLQTCFRFVNVEL